MDDKLLLRPEECALRLGVSRSTIYELLASHQLRSIVIGKSRRIEASALQDFIKRQRRAQAIA